MLKPVDIQNHTLKTSMSGYNKKETDEFLASVLESYEAIFKENRDLQDKITSLSEGIQYYKQMENTLQKALVLAEKTSSETQEAAKIQADNMVKEAQERADKIIEDAKAEALKIQAAAKQDCDAIKAKSLTLAQEYENYREQLKKLVASQLKLLESKEFNLDVPAKEEDAISVSEEKFSWNSDGHKALKSPEIESGFTFIDTE